ncbi:TetR/AcrR family transcriptional regulator [Phyllobacterium sp. P30BS-XVII]|uniref:TetR/AcrR family transcriptional regulator n=1 Tax=Phyllobacterium sp. P30BS-XVII TaxID=2587046 RepID=UPI000DD9D0B2|nr:TetR/AcrR family transcriptional regulator [Phyllobacterium sp. P30BS-XVII]MBA8903300.1 AcrR family transcriptional regulator [Phyllobacterium sp. P30BS-XVII]
MRYEKGHKESTRQQITEVAAKQFRDQGVSAVGLAAIMADAGLTNGAFYTHFSSKNDLVRECVEQTLDAQLQAISQNVSQHGLEAVLRQYLSPSHRDDRGHGCPSAALLPEISRQSPEIRHAYTARFNAVIEVIAQQLPGREPEDAHQTARAMFALVVGSLQLARAVDDPALSDDILEGAIAAVLHLASPRPKA